MQSQVNLNRLYDHWNVVLTARPWVAEVVRSTEQEYVRRSKAQIREEFRAAGVHWFWKHFRVGIWMNKPVLVKMVQTYRVLSRVVIPAQALMRRFIVRAPLLRKYGPAWNRRSLCVNDTDFMTLDPLASIPLEDFISYRDEQGLVHGFCLDSLHRWISQQRQSSTKTNPYTRMALPDGLVQMVQTRHVIDLVAEQEEMERMAQMSIRQRLRHEVTDLFMLFDSFGYYTNPSWFLQLSTPSVLSILVHLRRLWVVFLGDNDLRFQMCPPNGEWVHEIEPVFRRPDLDTNHYGVKLWVAQYLTRWILRAESREIQRYNVLYVLGSITFVSQEASRTLRWLQEAFLCPIELA